MTCKIITFSIEIKICNIFTFIKNHLTCNRALGEIMKKLMIIALLAFGVTTTASAHHMSFNPDAGESIPDWSPHLEMLF